ncbi:MAG: magnesium transporter CorA family protein [Geodermatophilales bacterium]|nr:magnesium transporter CorA family protein [Geodermatophilales bacterium]
MEILRVTADGVDRHDPDELDALLDAGDAASDGTGVLWVDVPTWDDGAAAVLTKRFGIHPRAAEDCARRNPVPKVHVYPGHVFVVLHTPERGARGHVHYIELDQFVGPNWLITVHGPINPAVAPAVAVEETRAVARRLESGRLRPRSAAELAFAVVTAMTGRLRDVLSVLTEEVWDLERRVTGGDGGDPEQFLEELFAVRHGLLTVRTMAALSREVFGRMDRLAVWPGPGAALLQDVEDQFRRVGAMAESQREYLQGVIEFYQTRTNTKMTIAAERLAVIAAVTLPITALSSVLGMNVIVNDRTHVTLLVVLLTIMAVMSAMVLLWAHRKGWW